MKPSLQIVDERQAFLAATFQVLIGRQPVDLPLDIEQAVDPFDGFDAIGEIGAAFSPRLAFALMSASTKNLRRECAQQNACLSGFGSLSPLNSGLCRHRRPPAEHR
ncbi:hypothetical protein C241_01684 [Bradyrhizobium lupini HPC(L)]|uniref:Uncharacterized protein n=1 Tax=Bradyrhizobium lupini HPC(L) TaxID=1229491 RepID=A0ABN0HS24_RHILU|nr:hypothetical protein C241_01684 [Bradyrhizobium lupini HPC(L)]